MSQSKILIVDDDRELVRAIAWRLKAAGFKPLTAFDGREGLAIARRERPAAIVLDLQMPVLDGFGVMERLQNSAHTASIPVIVLSAGSADRTRLEALESGAAYFVEKPYKPEDLTRALSAVLTRRGTAFGHQKREKNMSLAKRNMSHSNKVLIADDDPAVVRALTLRCRNLGLEVETAENGLQAILKASRNPPRLMILDVNMPEADGFRVCEWLLDPERPPVDVVMLTGRDDCETLQRCDSFGAFYVAKNHETWDAIKAILGEVLDLDEASVDEHHFKLDHSEETLKAHRRNKVLIVDDDEELVRALELRLRKCGAETLHAYNGIEAYRIAMKERPDLVIADYMMPEGGGHYLLWRLKSTDSTKHIPVIMITGQKFEKGTEFSVTRDTTGRYGAVQMFRKPLDTNALFEEVKRHCEIEYNAA